MAAAQSAFPLQLLPASPPNSSSPSSPRFLLVVFIHYLPFLLSPYNAVPEIVRDFPEDQLLDSELNLVVLKEARVFHFTSDFLTSSSMQ
ncbi:hypothetical protein MLD38_013916 [Melastoma candidum]|uniref:Uncharacterized protein n=1 Tax=Melastoma candidum TaxID=119954 RepID=A0ACB9RB34_9MYRT|nr:hypothetical protein MLD38_013916 [Melastoma candidum]